jgi:uncharacterized protein (UPF0335 family)
MTEAQIGDNSAVSAGRIRSIIERVEKVQSDIDDLNADKAEIFKEAKSDGLHIKAIKKIIAMRRMDRDKRREEAEILDLYLSAIGMVD